MVGLGAATASQYGATQQRYVIEQDDWCQPINPLSTGESIQEFYGYTRLDTPYDARDGTERTSTGIAEPGISQIFLFDHQGTICLAVIHDAYQASVGVDPTAWMIFNRLPSAGHWVVQDDPMDFDHRWSDPPHSIRWFWNRGESDGGAFCGGLNGEFEIVAKMLSMGAMNGWRFLTGDATHPDYVTLDPSEPLLIRTGTCPSETDDDRELDPTDPPQPQLPTVATESPKSVQRCCATLAGKLVALGTYSKVKVFFKWRRVGSNETFVTDKHPMSAPGPFYADLSGLEPGTTYEYRAMGTVVKTDDIVKGGIRKFTTPKRHDDQPKEPDDPKDPDDPDGPDKPKHPSPPLKAEDVVFCGCGRVCASGRGTGNVIVERPGGDGLIGTIQEFDFCTTPGTVGAPGGKILAVSATTNTGNKIVVLNPNHCAAGPIETHGLTGSTGRSGGPCNG